MQAQKYAVQDAERLMPLLRSIRRELRERNLRSAELEARLERLCEAKPKREHQIRLVESELSLHRRELRRLERELGELGCKLDEDRPLRILIPSQEGQLACDGELSKTRIQPLPQNVRAR